MVRIRRTAASSLAVALTLALSACGGGGKDTVTAGATSDPGGSMSMSHTMPDGSTMAQAMPGMNMMAFEGDGLKKSVDGYTFAKLANTAKVGRAGTLSFVISGPKGKPQKEFTLQQTKLLHMYVVRDDLTEFQHIHPDLDDKTGKWTVPITFAKPGPYQVVIEFEALKDDGNFDDRILGHRLTVAGDYKPVRYTPVTGTNTVDGYTVTMDPTAAVHGPNLHLKITKDGADVTDLQQYLQSYAHITGFRKGTMEAVHVHPNEVPPYKTDPAAVGGPTLTLASLFTQAGVYRMWIQFQTDGQVHTVPLDVTVS
jgi:hypothetical protein